MFKKVYKLIKSNYGRNYGWFIELDDEIIGKLVNPVQESQFWVSYQIIPNDKNWELFLFNEVNWKQKDTSFRYKNIGFLEYAPSAFSNYKLTGDRISMRGLYILPNNVIEDKLIYLMQNFSGMNG